MRRPPAGAAPSQARLLAPRAPGEAGVVSFSVDCPEEALVARAGGERPGMADGLSGRGGAWWGHAVGVGWAGVLGTWACREGSSHWPVGRKQRGWLRGPGEEGCSGRALWYRGPGQSRGAPPPLGDRRRPTIPRARSARLPGRRSCGERRAHTRAHNPREHAQCSPGNFLPRREPPRPPPGPLRPVARKVGGTAPSCRRFAPGPPALPLLGCPRCSRRSPPAAGNGGVDVTPTSPRSGPRPGGQRPGGEAA